MDLRWKTSFRASCFHAAELLSRKGVLADTALGETLTGPSQTLQRLITQLSDSPCLTWRRLLPLSGQLADNRQLAAATLSKPPLAVEADVEEEFVQAIRDIEDAVRGAFPDLLRDLASRERPLREQWEARGPGMLLQVRRLQPSIRLLPSADVLLVHPAQGGGGAAHLMYDSVRLEAVLAHPIPALPETVRLAWLLAQLTIDTPAIAKIVADDRLPLIAGLAMLPSALMAGEHVELCKYNRATVALAMESWLDCPSDDAELLMRWWETVKQQRLVWEASIDSLLHLLPESSR